MMNNAKHFIWEHKHRPEKLNDIIMPDNARKILSGFIKSGDIPNCLFYSESPGTGKTTTAFALCEELGVSYMKINAALDKGIDVIRTTVNRFASTASFNENQKFKVIIFDEFDRMHPDAIEALKGVFDEFAETTRFILTCNNIYRIPSPIRSRCQAQIKFSFDAKYENDVKKQIYERLISILVKENVEFSKKTIAHIVNECYPDIREMVGVLQNLSNLGKIDGDSYQMFVSSNIDELINVMKINHPAVKEGYANIRNFIITHINGDYQKMLSHLAEKLVPHLVPTAVPEMIMIIADYMYKDTFVLDKEINFMAAIVEILMNCDMK